MIPKIIHHIAPEDSTKWHPVWDRCYPTWLQNFPKPEYTHMLWSDDDDLNNIVSTVFPHYSVEFNNLKHIQKIDIAKMVMIYKYGGLYVDMDYYCKSNFFDDFSNRVVVSGSPHPKETMQNGMIAAEPEHPFILEHIRDMFDNIKTIKEDNVDKADNYIKITTGPYSLTKTYNNHKEHWTDIQILDCKTYNPVISSFYHKSKMTGVKCIHLLTGWWGKETRKDKRAARKQYEDWRKIKLGDL